MSTESRTDPGTAGADPATLGDLLYADKSIVRDSEKQWVALVQRIAAGDKPALRVLFERTQSIVFIFLLRMVKDRASAEELTLDVFQEVWRGASTYDASSGSVVGWIMKLSRSKALRFEKQKRGVSRHADDRLPRTASATPDER